MDNQCNYSISRIRSTSNQKYGRTASDKNSTGKASDFFSTSKNQSNHSVPLNDSLSNHLSDFTKTIEADSF